MNRFNREMSILKARWALRGRRTDVGHRVSCIGSRPHVWVEGQLTVGRRVVLMSEGQRVVLRVSRGGRLAIGDNCLLNSGAYLDCAHSLTLGDGARVGPGAYITDTNRHEVEPGSGIFSAPTILGADSWVGAHAVILPGVTVGAGAVVAAGAVVNMSIPENSLAAGVPARVVRSWPAKGRRV